MTSLQAAPDVGMIVGSAFTDTRVNSTQRAPRDDPISRLNTADWSCHSSSRGGVIPGLPPARSRAAPTEIMDLNSCSILKSIYYYHSNS